MSSTPTRRDRLQADLSAAMRRRDKELVAVLRTTSAAIANAEAVDPATVPAGATEAARRVLTDDEVRAIIAVERDDLRATASELTEHGRADAAEPLLRQAAQLDAYL